MMVFTLNIDNMKSWGLGFAVAFQFLTTDTLPVLQIATKFGLVVNVSLGIHELGVAPLARDKFSNIEILQFFEFIHLYEFQFI